MANAQGTRRGGWFPYVWAGTGIGKDAASDHILWTGYWRFALFALHGVRDFGQKTGHESARTWRGSYGCQTSVLLDSRLSALRIIETFSKRMYSYSRASPACRIASPRREYLHNNTRVHMLIIVEQVRKESVSRVKTGRSSSLLRA